jgi:hypothetical protein
MTVNQSPTQPDHEKASRTTREAVFSIEMGRTGKIRFCDRACDPTRGNFATGQQKPTELQVSLVVRLNAVRQRRATEDRSRQVFDDSSGGLSELEV